MIFRGDGIPNQSRGFRDRLAGLRVASIGLRVGDVERAAGVSSLDGDDDDVVERRTEIFLETGVGIDFGEFLGIRSATQGEIAFKLMEGF